MLCYSHHHFPSVVKSLFIKKRTTHIGYTTRHVTLRHRNNLLIFFDFPRHRHKCFQFAMGLRKIMRPSSRQKQKELERALNFSNVSDKDMRNHHRAMIMKLAKRAGAKKMTFQKHLYTRKEDFKKTSIEYETDSKDDDTIEQLEADVRRLAKKCEALESQNILVSVQQLDYLARILTMLLCLFALLLYWKVVVFGTNAMNTIAVNGQQSSFFVGLAKNSLTIVLLRGILMSMPFVYNHKTHASINRRFQVFVVAFIVIGRIRLCRWRERTFVQTGINENSSDVGNRINRFGESCTEGKPTVMKISFYLTH